jgi:fatty-acid desaturase
MDFRILENMTESKWSRNFINLHRKIDTKQDPSEGTNAVHRHAAYS